MIVATITALLLLFGLGGSDIENLYVDIKKPVKQAVDDSTRRSEILKISKDLEKQLKSLRKARDKQIEKLVEIQASHGSSHAEFSKQSSEIRNLFKSTYVAVLDARSELKGQMSENEWNQVFAKKNSPDESPDADIKPST